MGGLGLLPDLLYYLGKVSLRPRAFFFCFFLLNFGVSVGLIEGLALHYIDQVSNYS